MDRETAGESVTGVVHHSDAGSTPPSATPSGSPTPALASIGSVGNSYDCALAESTIGLYKTGCVRPDGPFRTVDDLELATLDWVHWFNHHRLLEVNGDLPPIELEQAYYRLHNSDLAEAG